MAIAAAPAQSRTSSAGDLSWAEFILDGPSVSSPRPFTTISSDSNLSSSVNLSNLGPVRCFQNPLAPAPTIYPSIIVYDYLEALEKIVVSDDALRILSWNFRPNESMKWNSNGCRIAVGVPGSAGRTVSGVFQPIVIAHLAAKVARECFQPGRVLGGDVRFGDYQELIVVLGALRSNEADTAIY